MRQLLQRITPSLSEAFSASSGVLERIAFALLLVFLVVVPLPLGGTLPAGRLRLELFAFLITTATYLSRPRSREPALPAVPLAAALAIAALGGLQLVPLPDPLLVRISPVSEKIYHETGALLARLGQPADLVSRITIAPVETAATIRLVLADVALFVSAVRLLSTRARRRVFITMLLAAACVHVVIAVALQISEPRLKGAFANPDHFGGYLEISLAVAFGLLWAEVLVNADRGGTATDRATRVESRLLPLAARALVWAVLAIGIALTQSRGAIAAAIFTTLAMLAGGVAHPRSRGRGTWRGALALAAGLAVVVFVAGRAALLRFVASSTRDLRGGSRLELWKTSVAAWKEFPWLGSGLGSFADAFRRVQTRELGILVEQAHSDPLQMLVTGGVVGAFFGALLYASLFLVLIRLWYRQKHRQESAFALAGLGALLSLTVHGLVEYNMSIPAIPATLAAVIGMAYAAGAGSPAAR